MYDAYCTKHYANGHCDKGCDIEECVWDGLDCEEDLVPKYAKGDLIIIVLMLPEQFLEIAAPFLRNLGQLLHSIITIKKDPSGREMVYPWPSESRRKRSVISEYLFGAEPDAHQRFRRASR